MALFLFTGAVLRGERMEVFGHGRMHRDFTYVDDIAAGVVSAIDRNHELLVCNLAAGRTEELMEFIQQIESSCGREGDKEFLPMQAGGCGPNLGRPHDRQEVPRLRADDHDRRRHSPFRRLVPQLLRPVGVAGAGPVIVAARTTSGVTA